MDGEYRQEEGQNGKYHMFLSGIHGICSVCIAKIIVNIKNKLIYLSVCIFILIGLFLRLIYLF